MEMEIFEGAVSMHKFTDFDEDQAELLLKFCFFLRGDFFEKKIHETNLKNNFCFWNCILYSVF